MKIPMRRKISECWNGKQNIDDEQTRQADKTSIEKGNEENDNSR